MFSNRTMVGVGAVLGAAGMCVLAAPAVAGTGGAPPLHVTKVVSSGYVGPLQFAIGNGQVVVSDSFQSTLFAAKFGGTPVAIAQGGPRGDVAGVAFDSATHAIAFTRSDHSHRVTTLTIEAPGAATVKADLAAYEAANNPDGTIHYGTDSTDPCVTSTLTKLHAPISYTGLVDSHPYAVASLGNGSWVVADAGANDLLEVGPTGVISTVAVMPPAVVTFTAQSAAASGLPACFAGVTYRFESVPTDVEVGPDGALYVTDLPGGIGGPADPGMLYRVTPGTAPQLVASGFASATNLAVLPGGRIFVANLDTGTVSEVSGGRTTTVLTLPGVVALEYYHGDLYASTAPLLAGGTGPGQIVELGR